MKRFLINCTTYWCGMDTTYRTEAESELELEELADYLAYQNFQTYGLDEDIAEEEGYNPEEMSEEDWVEMWENCDETVYYGFSIEEFNGDDEEWESYPEAE